MTRKIAVPWLVSHLGFSSQECLLWPFKSRYKSGYGSVWIDGKLTGAHRAMLRLKTGDCPLGMTAAHSCGVKLCVNPNHLRWATQSENEADKKLHGTAQIGEGNGAAKLMAADVCKIKAMLFERLKSHREISEQFSISRRTVSAISEGKLWAHISP